MSEGDLPTTIVIFGASGDLAQRKLVPALYSQFAKGRLPYSFRIVGFARREYSDGKFRDELRRGMQELAELVPQEKSWQDFSQRISYFRGDVTRKEDFAALATFLEQVEGKDAHRLYYLATVPEYFPLVVEYLGQAQMAEEGRAWRRIIVEKPFGRDLNSGIRLNQALHAVFHEHQIYRIDHYLGKETAQNILYFRFLNTIFEPVWNRNYVDHVQVTVFEETDVAHRAGYYDQAGVVRDVFQSHLMQLLALVAMEPPASSDADAVRNEKVQVLRSVRPIVPGDTLRAQYQGYQETEGVARDSQTPTFAVVKLYIDNWRWQGVPFYLCSGKSLAAKSTQVVIEFRSPPHVMFALPKDYHLTPNSLSLCIQPDEGILLRFETKVPDTSGETRSVDMEFHYRLSFREARIPEAYERLLLDALQGDASLFTRSDEIEAAWSLVDPILQAWEESPQAFPLASYAPGSWGPAEAEAFMRRDGRRWRLACKRQAEP